MFTFPRMKTAIVGSAILLIAATPVLAYGSILERSGLLHDLAPDAQGPFDGAEARVHLVESAAGTQAVLKVRNIGSGAEGQTFGAHLHDGPCVAGSPAAAGGHYNVHAHRGMNPVRVNDQTEIWLDFTVSKGSGSGRAKVPFVPEAGDRSIVIHALPTDSASGAAGARLACLTASW